MFNIKNNLKIDEKYQQGLLPQRNHPDLFYQETSCRSNLSSYSLSSENRRIIRKTDEFSFKVVPISEFILTPTIQKEIRTWVKQLNWNFPTSSIKTIFTNHIFNFVYVWTTSQDLIVAYSVCYFDSKIAHIGYVFYNPTYSHGDLPIRLVLQFVIDCRQKQIDFAYLGRFSETTGFYKRNMPGFEYYQNNQWLTYKH